MFFRKMNSTTKKELKMKISLAKALQYKKRVVGEVARVQQLVNSNNSLTVQQRESSDVNIKETVDKYFFLRNYLLDLKSKLDQANHIPDNNGETQQLRILKLQELKSEVAFYQSLSTTTGKMVNDYYDKQTVTEYDAYIKRAEVETKVLELNKSIDRLQEEIEKVNYNLSIEIEDIGLI